MQKFSGTRLSMVDHRRSFLRERLTQANTYTDCLYFFCNKVQTKTSCSCLSISRQEIPLQKPQEAWLQLVLSILLTALSGTLVLPGTLWVDLFFFSRLSGELWLSFVGILTSLVTRLNCLLLSVLPFVVKLLGFLAEQHCSIGTSYLTEVRLSRWVENSAWKLFSWLSLV